MLLNIGSATVFRYVVYFPTRKATTSIRSCCSTTPGRTLEMIQLWVNLPATAKQSPPKYQDLLSAQIPSVQLPDDAGTARVIAGDLLEANGPASTFTPINLWDLQMNAGGRGELKIPTGHTSLLIVQSGIAKVNGESIQAVELALFERDGSSITIESATVSRMLVLTGEPIGEPVVGQGPFVMNTREEIRAAMRDFQAGKMGHLS